MREKLNLGFTLTSLWLILLIILGAWWLYLIIDLANKVEMLSLLVPSIELRPNFANMIKWEGITFFILLALISISLFGMYLKDNRKTKALSAFFASLTHELKTPLASIRLQSEVIKESIEEKEYTTVPLLMDRLIEGTQKLESELDKILQLSRVERNGKLTAKEIDINKFLSKLNEKYPYVSFDLHLLDTDEDTTIFFDEHALVIILRNLIENTLKYAKKSNQITIELQHTSNFIKMTYNDQGGPFQGDVKKLGKLFYTHNTSQGSGIGLYLIYKLVKRLRGKFKIEGHPQLIFHIYFPIHRKGVI